MGHRRSGAVTTTVAHPAPPREASAYARLTAAGRRDTPPFAAASRRPGG
ncbi:hypothetical protein [Streptomyces sp. XH2]